MSRRRFLPALLLVPALCACSDLRSERGRANSARVDAENAVLIASRMPKSVVFRNEVVRLAPGGPVVCGEFNGQNRRQEWVGFTRFIHTREETWVDDGGADFDGRWRESCDLS
jgi:hypothetical protein